nr:amidase [Maricaulis sp.]
MGQESGETEGISDSPQGGEISSEQLRSAEALFDVSYTEAERAQIIDGLEEWKAWVEQLRALDKPNHLAPATVFDPRLPGHDYPAQENSVTGAGADAGSLPGSDTAIAFAPLWKQAQWLRRGALTSQRLTEIYLSRISRHGAALECFVTVTADMAREQAARADRELAEGRDRGPLHGIPYGMKDIIDVAGIASTWGAMPYRDRVASEDAHITRLLTEAGAVHLGKTTNGALAYGDLWFGGRTRNPWNLEEGSSGSSAGSASATAAGLVSFAIGTETLGSIVSPSNRCGTTGLRPTFGRVSRAGAMALCWSLDKIGPITRSVEDTAWVLGVLNGYDAGDAGSIAHGFTADLSADVRGLRVGYDPAWFEQAGAADRAALDAARDAGVELVEFALPDLPYDALFAVVEAESAAAFEELTLSNRDDELRWQSGVAWPNTWRRARLISAIDLINVDRLRRRIMHEFDQAMTGLDAVIGPNFAGSMLTITNYTGHPQLAVKSGYNEIASRVPNGETAADPEALHRVPQTTSVWAPLFREDNALRLGLAIERRLGVAEDHPPLFL